MTSRDGWKVRGALASQGMTLGPDGEVDQARVVVAALSQRSVRIAASRDTHEAAWRAKYPDRAPSKRVEQGWDRQGWEATRPSKKASTYESPEQLSERVTSELGALGEDYRPGTRAPIAIETTSIGSVDRDAVAAEAVARLSAKRSAWSEATLTAEMATVLSATGVVGERQAVIDAVEDCGARAQGRCASLLEEGHTATVVSLYLTSDPVIGAEQTVSVRPTHRGGRGGKPAG